MKLYSIHPVQSYTHRCVCWGGGDKGDAIDTRSHAFKDFDLALHKF